MTKAKLMMERWISQKEPIESGEFLAREIDPRCHIYGFLHTGAKNIVFSDGSKAKLTLGGSKLEIIK